jgi:hypothetical protein
MQAIFIASAFEIYLGSSNGCFQVLTVFCCARVHPYWAMIEAKGKAEFFMQKLSGVQVSEHLTGSPLPIYASMLLMV